MSIKNSNETIANRTRDLPACSAVPQPTAPRPARRSVREQKVFLHDVLESTHLKGLSSNKVFLKFFGFASLGLISAVNITAAGLLVCDAVYF
jgi:hypothetical protein